MLVGCHSLQLTPPSVDSAVVPWLRSECAEPAFGDSATGSVRSAHHDTPPRRMITQDGAAASISGGGREEQLSAGAGGCHFGPFRLIPRVALLLGALRLKLGRTDDPNTAH